MIYSYVFFLLKFRKSKGFNNNIRIEIFKHHIGKHMTSYNHIIIVSKKFTGLIE